MAMRLPGYFPSSYAGVTPHPAGAVSPLCAWIMPHDADLVSSFRALANPHPAGVVSHL
jgi:hypothetical protein